MKDKKLLKNALEIAHPPQDVRIRFKTGRFGFSKEKEGFV